MQINTRPKLVLGKPKHEHRLKIILVSTLFCLLFSLAYFFPTGIRGLFYTISRPFWLGETMVTDTAMKVKNFFVFKSVLISQNLSIQDELASLKLKEFDYDTIVKENHDLKNQLGRTVLLSRILSRIISSPPLSPYDTLVLDAGSNEGVTVGSKVYLSDNIIIGAISSVTSNNSVLKLFSTSGEKTTTVLERTGAFFELTGRGGANLELEAPKETDILWGDLFMYPNITPSIVASVYYIDTNSQSSFKKIYLRIPGNVFSAKWVFIEKGAI